MLEGGAQTGDVRKVEVTRHKEGGLVVAEQMAGPDVALVFECESWCHEVCVLQASLPALASRLSVEVAGLAEALEEWLAKNYLTDLMDELDIAGISYTYAADTPQGAVVRPAGSGAW